MEGIVYGEKTSIAKIYCCHKLSLILSDSQIMYNDHCTVIALGCFDCIAVKSRVVFTSIIIVI